MATRRRNPSSFVGSRIREAIQALRGEAHDLRKRADDIEAAWGEHDYAYLRDVGVITASQYADIMAEAALHTNPVVRRMKPGTRHVSGWHYYRVPGSSLGFFAPSLTAARDYAEKHFGTRTVRASKAP